MKHLVKVEGEEEKVKPVSEGRRRRGGRRGRLRRLLVHQLMLTEKRGLPLSRLLTIARSTGLVRGVLREELRSVVMEEEAEESKEELREEMREEFRREVRGEEAVITTQG